MKSTKPALKKGNSNHLILQGDRRDYDRLLKTEAKRKGIVWGSLKNAQIGDLAYFFFQDRGAIVALGRIASRPRPDPKWIFGTMVDQVTMLRKPLTIEEMKEKLPKWEWLGYPRARTYLPPGVSKVIAALVERRTNRKPKKRVSPRSSPPMVQAEAEQSLKALEGIKREITFYGRTRNRRLRNEALELSGGICETCGVNFNQFLGGLGKRVLQVHHRKQLSTYKFPSANGVEDLAVLCANCHAMVHFNPKKAMPVEELHRKFKRARR